MSRYLYHFIAESAGTDADAELAVGTGSAHNASVHVAPNAGVASGTGAALDATVTTAVDTNAAAGLASGSGSAGDAAAAVAAGAGAAGATGAAHDATASSSVSVAADAASGTGAAAGASSQVDASAGAASGTGAAHDATAVPGMSAAAGAASGTGAAQGPAASVSVGGGAASGSGSSFDATTDDGSCNSAFQASAFQNNAFQICAAGGDENPEDAETGVGVDDAYVEKDTPGVAAETGVGVDAAYVDKDNTGASDETGSGYDSAFVTKFGGALPEEPPVEVPVTIRYDGIEITSRVMYTMTSFTSAANGGVGSCRIRVRDDNQEYSFVGGRRLELEINGQREWTGYSTSIRRGYYTLTDQAPGEIVRYFDIEGVDLNILFQKRILYDKANPTKGLLTTYPAGTHDDVIVKAYIQNHLDLSGYISDTSLIEYVGTPSSDSEIFGHAGWTWGQFMQSIQRDVGSIYYIDPDGRVVLTDVDTPNAPWGISDAPGAGEVGARDLEIDHGGENLRNDVLGWGAGQGEDHMIFSRVTDDDSIATHGRWQVGLTPQPVWRQPTLDRITNSWVYGSPQNKRGGKDDAVAVRTVLRDQGLRVGMKANVRSEVYGYEDVLPCRQMEVTFLTQTAPRWTATLSHELDTPWSTFEYWIPEFTWPPFLWEEPDWRIDWPVFPPPFDPCAESVYDSDVSVGEMMGIPGISLLIPTTGGVTTAPAGVSWSNPVFKFQFDIKRVDGVVTIDEGDDITSVIDVPATDNTNGLDEADGNHFVSVIKFVSGSSARTLCTLNPSVSVSGDNPGGHGPKWAEWEVWMLWPDLPSVFDDETPFDDIAQGIHPPGILLASSETFGPFVEDAIRIGRVEPPGSPDADPVGSIAFYAPKGVATLMIRATSWETPSGGVFMTLTAGNTLLDQTQVKFAVPPPGFWEPSPCAEVGPGGYADGPTGNTEETAEEIPTPSGEDPTSTWFQTAHQYLVGSERVYLNGLLLRPGEDYLRHPIDRWIEILSSVTINPGDVVSIDYEVFLSTPAPEPL